MSELFTQTKQKRVDQVVAGDIIRSAKGEHDTIKGWSEVMSVEVDEEYPATTIKFFRPPTEMGRIAPARPSRMACITKLLPSFDLVDVQRTVDRFGVGVQ
jgi:hypothetical protein